MTKTAPLIGDSGIPAYCLKKIGSRHFLVGGGGGASKTGVQNEIQTHLFTTDSASPDVGFRAECVDKFDTESMATMNMDVSGALDEAQERFVIVAGQENFCCIYMTRGMRLNEDQKLAFEMSKVARIRTDFHSNNSYQKCVRFDRTSRGKIFATGGADGNVRVWDAQAIFRSENAQPLLTIQAHKADVDDLDFSNDAKTIISIGAEGAFIWSTENGQKLLDLQFPIEIARGFKLRSVRCTPLGVESKNTVFVAAYNSISRGSKDQASYLALWAFNAERKMARPIVTKLMAKGQSISSLSVSECGNFTAVGTMSGSVGVFDTHDLSRLHFSPDSHGLFVTGIEFVAATAAVPLLSGVTPSVVTTPGVSSGFQTSVVTLAADKTMQLHRVPFSRPRPLTEILLAISLICLLFSLFSSQFLL